MPRQNLNEKPDIPT